VPPEEQQWSDAAVAQLPAWTLIQAYHVVARRFRTAFAQVDLGPAHFGVLATLATNPGLGQGELARRNLVSPQSIGELIASLERRGLVTRPAPTGRGRARPVQLTDAGRAALARATPGVLAVNAAAALGLSDAEAAELNRLLHLVCASPGA
jgi:DNA-binding MarR family transcriptional regulator